MCGSAPRCASGGGAGRRAKGRWSSGASVRGVVPLLLVAWVGAAAAQPRSAPEDESEIHVDTGEQQLARRQYRQAAQSFERALEVNPRRIDTYRRLADAYYRLNDFDRAVARLRAAHGIARGDARVTAELGAYLLETGTDTEALPMLREVLGDGGGALDERALDRAYRALARHWQRRGALRGAVVAMRHLHERHRTPATAMLLAELYVRVYLPERARIVLEAQGASTPEAKLGLAEALCAIDCGRAGPLLAALDAKEVPAVLLLRGRCALGGSNPQGALEQARAYLVLARGRGLPQSPGLGLAADALRAERNLGEARRNYEASLAPSASDRRDRLWKVRLAGLHTLEGHPELALRELAALGPPAPRASDAEWWLERARAALALGDAQELRAVRDELTPLLGGPPLDPSEEELFSAAPAPLPDARLWAELGKIESALGGYERAVHALEASLSLRPRRQSVRRELVRTAVLWAAQELERGAAVEAEKALRRVSPQYGGAPSEQDVLVIASWYRNLGIAALAQERGDDAARAFETALSLTPQAMRATTELLYGRALAKVGKLEQARRYLADAAQHAVGDERKLIAIERASLDGEAAPEDALRILRAVADEPAEPQLEAMFQRARISVQHASAVARLRAGDSAGAYALLEELAGPTADPAIRCNFALAAVAARRRSAALVVKQLGAERCSFGGSSEGLAILSATLDGQVAGAATKALGELRAVARRAPAARALATAAIRVVALSAAEQEYRRGDLDSAHRYLEQARQARTAIGADELAHNQIALALARAGRALPTKTLEGYRAELLRLEARVPEAAITLGLVYERLRQPLEALAAWRRVHGVRFAPLLDWIRAKQLVTGGS